MPVTTGPYEIHTQARGPHWIAWLTLEGDIRPHRSMVFVARSEDEAEARARAWAERSSD